MVEMKVLTNREEWLKNRTSTIGGSDASAILGLNPWMSNEDLWEYKTRKAIQPDIGDNPIVQFGISAEPLMREMFKLDYPQYDVDYVENNIWTNTNVPFAHASLDGWLTEKATGRKGIFENKTVNIQAKGQTDKWKDGIPDYYYCQLLHYFLVTEFDFAILKARLRWEAREDSEVYCQIRHYRVERVEVEDDIMILAKAEEEFHNRIKNNSRPNLILPGI